MFKVWEQGTVVTVNLGPLVIGCIISTSNQDEREDCVRSVEGGTVELAYVEGRGNEVRMIVIDILAAVFDKLSSKESQVREV